MQSPRLLSRVPPHTQHNYPHSEMELSNDEQAVLRQRLLFERLFLEEMSSELKFIRDVLAGRSEARTTPCDVVLEALAMGIGED